ncbi:MAG: endonuclease/exonuclease/phosphatase family protein [Labilithrix sp.]|nr:endonuclease/exonuclease/phosphatase family protein [Labilithrix sp.]
MLAALAVAGCGVSTEEEEPVGTDAEEISTARCAGTTARAKARIKVMTLNLRHDSDEWKRRFELIADEIDRVDPDVIGLQEIEIGAGQSGYLNGLLAKRGHAKYNVYEKRKSGFRGYFTGEGVGIMSRWPIVEEHHEDTGNMRISLFARVKHPNGGFFDVVNTHLHNGGGEANDAERLDQAKQTVGLANRWSDCYATVLTGDMNASPTSPAMKHFAGAGFVDSYEKVHGADAARTGNTSPVVLREGAFEQSPRRRIDFVLGRRAGARVATPLSSAVVLKNHDAKGFYPSDHFAVMTTYDLGF